MELTPGTLLHAGKYKIIEKLGQGGFGIAYRAHHQSLKRDVCIKEFFYSDLCERSQNSVDVTVITKAAEKLNLVNSLKKKFIKEAQRLAKFQHPNIVQVTDTFEENNTAYFVMEYLQGGSLEDLLSREGALSEHKTKELILPIIDALDAVHKTDLLHLDIKPANIMLRNNQTPVLIDFGISKYMDFAPGYTTTAPIGISKGYAPLEQYGGNRPDFSKATDIYSLCATIYKMVTGITPPEPLQMLSSGLKSPREINAEISIPFSSAILTGLAIKASERHQSMSHLMKVIYPIKHPKETVFNKSNIIHTKTEHLKLVKYSSIYSFSDELARVECEGKWGFIDKNGNEVIKCKYDKVSDFTDGMAAVSLDGKWWGYIDKQGYEVFPFIYSVASDFHEDLASVCLDHPNSHLNAKDHEWGYINKNGELIIKLNGWGHDFTEGFARIGLFSNYKYIDKKGKIVIPCKYYQSGDFSEGLAYIVKKTGIFNKKEKYGFMDKQGNEVISCIYDSAYNFSEGLSRVSLNGKYGFINLDGIEVISCKFDWAMHFSEGLALIENNKKYGFIDNYGVIKILCLYDGTGDFNEGIARVCLNKKWGCINKNGHIIVPLIYDEIYNFSEDRAVVKINGFYSVIDNTGKVILE
ncbi:MAG: WG repeat-containing protein [Bacteroidales bacterium]|nr:WG repeat-containing protein [Bacteroidales bacterium]